MRFLGVKVVLTPGAGNGARIVRLERYGSVNIC